MLVVLNNKCNFNLDEYLKNPNKKVITRDGNSVRILCTDAKGNFPIIALVEIHNDTELVIRLRENGHFYNDTEDSRDLFFTPEKNSGWINLYKINSTISPGPRAYNTKEDAESVIGDKSYYISTIKIEWEE